VAGEPATSPYYCAWCVFEAALRALDSAWSYDQSRAVLSPPEDATNCADDACTYAAIAAGGGTWRPIVQTGSAAGAVGRWEWQTEDVRLRRAVFWEWWLRDAVSTAWRRV
jgi:hypothetical protein